jgi:hypothetical protein
MTGCQTGDVMRRILGVAVLCFALVGCGCTHAGCESLLQLEFMNVEFQPGSTYHLDICVDSDCITESVTMDDSLVWAGDGQILVRADSNTIEYLLPENDYPESVEVSVTVSNANGAVLANSVDDVQVARTWPNGRRCEPTCFNGQLTI